MSMIMRHFIASTALLQFLGGMGCRATEPSSTPTPIPPLARPGYALVGTSGGSDFEKNALIVFDPTSWQVHRSIKIQESYTGASLARDPQGRLWVAYQRRPDTLTDDRVQVFLRDGDLKATLKPCRRPIGFHFAMGRAYVACQESGFSGRIVALDSESFKSDENVEVTYPGSDSYMLLSVGGTQQNIVVSGTIQPAGSPPIAVSLHGVSVFDARTLTVVGRASLGEPSEIRQIVSDGSNVYLPNTVSGYQKTDQARTDRDLFVVPNGDLGGMVSFPAGRSPRSAVVVGNDLYLLSPTVPARVTKVGLAGRTVTDSWTFEMPGTIFDSYLTAMDDRLLVAQFNRDTDTNDGIYEFIPSTGEYVRRMAIPDVNQVLVP